MSSAREITSQFLRIHTKHKSEETVELDMKIQNLIHSCLIGGSLGGITHADLSPKQLTQSVLSSTEAVGKPLSVIRNLSLK